MSFQRNTGELEAEVQALFERNDSLVLCRAAQLGDETVIREFLKKFRNEVNIILLYNDLHTVCNIMVLIFMFHVNR